MKTSLSKITLSALLISSAVFAEDAKSLQPIKSKESQPQSQEQVDRSKNCNSCNTTCKTKNCCPCPKGPTGATGAQGPQGPQGDPGTDVTAANYLNSVRLDETVLPDGVPTDVLFTDNGPINGWTQVGDEFICPVTGTYQVSYTLEFTGIDSATAPQTGVLARVSAALAINGTVNAKTEVAMDLQQANSGQELPIAYTFSHSFLINFTAGNAVKLVAQADLVNPNASVILSRILTGLGVTPSATITINRIA